MPHTVKSYMQTKPKKILVSGTMKDAVREMLHQKTNGLVVVDENNAVVGILSSWDIIELIVPDYLEDDKHLAAFEDGDIFTQQIQKVQDTPITDFMTKKVHTVTEKDNIMEAAILLSEFKIRQLPVVDNNNTLLGYINRTDIKHAIGDVLQIAKED